MYNIVCLVWKGQARIRIKPFDTSGIAYTGRTVYTNADDCAQATYDIKTALEKAGFKAWISSEKIS